MKQTVTSYDVSILTIPNTQHTTTPASMDGTLAFTPARSRAALRDRLVAQVSAGVTTNASAASLAMCSEMGVKNLRQKERNSGSDRRPGSAERKD